MDRDPADDSDAPDDRASDNAIGDDRVALAAAGDREALGLLWEHWNPALLRFLRSLRVDEPDDVAAEVWVDLARRMPEVDPDMSGHAGAEAAFRRLLFTIGRRRAIDARRYRFRRPQSHLSDATAASLSSDDDDEGALTDALAVQQLLSQLAPAQAEVVALRVLGGFSAAEVGVMTGRSEGAVRIMMMRGLRRLREMAETSGVFADETSDDVDPDKADDAASNGFH